MFNSCFKLCPETSAESHLHFEAEAILNEIEPPLPPSVTPPVTPRRAAAKTLAASTPKPDGSASSVAIFGPATPNSAVVVETSNQPTMSVGDATSLLKETSASTTHAIVADEEFDFVNSSSHNRSRSVAHTITLSMDASSSEPAILSVPLDLAATEPTFVMLPVASLEVDESMPASNTLEPVVGMFDADLDSTPSPSLRETVSINDEAQSDQSIDAMAGSGSDGANVEAAAINEPVLLDSNSSPLQHGADMPPLQFAAATLPPSSADQKMDDMDDSV
jgi:hypothetical protein